MTQHKLVVMERKKNDIHNHKKKDQVVETEGVTDNGTIQNSSMGQTGGFGDVGKL